MTDIAAPTGACPYHRLAAPPARSRADLVARKLLRVPDHGSPSAGAAERGFRRSMLISTVRCTLTYLVFPFALPAFGLVAGVGLAIGLVIGAFAIVCDVFAIRRFFAVDHRWRWQFSAIALTVVCLLAVLLVQDVVGIVA